MIKYTFILKNRKRYIEVSTQKALKKLSTFEIKWKFFCISGRIKYVTQLERVNDQFPEEKKVDY